MIDTKSQLDVWNEAEEIEVSTTELDELVVKMQTEWDAYEKQKKLANDLLTKYEQTESDLLLLLDKAKKTKYIVEGVGTVSRTEKFMVKTPKDITSKKQLFDYIREKHGVDELLGLTSINSQTLNAFYNAEMNNDPLTKIPGLEPPTARVGLTFRKEAKKG